MTRPAFDAAAATSHLAKRDATLGRLIRRVGPCLLETASRQSPYEALFESIVYQQLSSKAAAAIYSRACTAFGAKNKTPKPVQLTAGSALERLRSAGLSRSKAVALQDLAKKTLAGEIPTRKETKRLSDDELVERLTEVRGVGRWTVEMFLIFNLGRPDVLPVDDFGVKKGFAKAFHRNVLPRPKELAEHGERWRPFRTVASWYLWRATELD